MLPNNEVDDMQHSFAEAHRKSLSVDDEQDLMIGCAWTTPSEERLLKMFSEVLHIDALWTPIMRIVLCSLLSPVVIQTERLTIVRAFLPNERAWVFCWLFQTVMPTLLGKDYIGRVRASLMVGGSNVVFRPRGIKFVPKPKM
jgi:hypothetical protein